MFCRAPLADMVTAPGKVFVNPWSAPPPGELTAPETNRVSCAALRPLSGNSVRRCCSITCLRMDVVVSTCVSPRSEEHTSELQSLAYLVCRLLLEKKKTRWNYRNEINLI